MNDGRRLETDHKTDDDGPDSLESAAFTEAAFVWIRTCPFYKKIKRIEVISESRSKEKEYERTEAKNMKIFVAAWYFPPSLSSEGIVTYKLLRNSTFDYDVATCKDPGWGFHAPFETKDDQNIRVFLSEPMPPEAWMDWCIQQFEEHEPEEHYAAIMTRSMPEWAVEIGHQIKEKYPDIPWIASINDPIGNYPYNEYTLITQNTALTETEREQAKKCVASRNEQALLHWSGNSPEEMHTLGGWIQLEKTGLTEADLVTSPSLRQFQFLGPDVQLLKRWAVVPHSYDADFYDAEITERLSWRNEPVESGENSKGTDNGTDTDKDTDKDTNADIDTETQTDIERYDAGRDKIVISYLGLIDEIRSIDPFLKALHLLLMNDPAAFARLEVNIYGGYPPRVRDEALNLGIYTCIHFRSSVSYYDSLKIMQRSDWLLHIDSYFADIPEGGAVFFAGKLADYMGAGRPILALTGEGTPADQIVRQYGGISIRQQDILGLYTALKRITAEDITAEGTEARLTSIDSQYRAMYDARRVAADFDREVRMILGNPPYDILVNSAGLPVYHATEGDTILSVILMDYRSPELLDRALFTLFDQNMNGSVEAYIDLNHSSEGQPHPDSIRTVAEKYMHQYPANVRLLSIESAASERKNPGSEGSEGLEKSEDDEHEPASMKTAIPCPDLRGRYVMILSDTAWLESEQLQRFIQKVQDTDIRTESISFYYKIYEPLTSRENFIKFNSDLPLFSSISVKENGDEKDAPGHQMEENLGNICNTILRADLFRNIYRNVNWQIADWAKEYATAVRRTIQTVTLTDFDLVRINARSHTL